MQSDVDYGGEGCLRCGGCPYDSSPLCLLLISHTSVQTDVDCGGEVCPACDDGKACNAATDCASKACPYGLCISAADACSDGAQDGAEVHNIP